MNLLHKHNLDDLMYATNIADMLDDQDLTTIGSQVVKDFDADLLSRETWEKRVEASLRSEEHTSELQSH